MSAAMTWEREFNACENCEGQGGFPRDEGAYDEGWIECPSCDGLGYVDEPPAPLTQADLDQRAGR